MDSRYSLHTWKWVVVVAALATCQRVSDNLLKLPCDDQLQCVDGYVCHPEDLLCVAFVGSSCAEGEDLCYKNVRSDMPCSSEGSFMPCGDYDDCRRAGCRTCNDGVWSTCSGGPDGTCGDMDADGDGICDPDDVCHDEDGDGAGLAGSDSNGCTSPRPDPNDGDRFVCGDSDDDGCDDCSNEGVFAPNKDGEDTDADGLCDSGRDDDAEDGDLDDDNDGVPDDSDPAPLDPFQCGDADRDLCDDCTRFSDGFGPLPDHDVSNDGPDEDQDGICSQRDCDDNNAAISPNVAEHGGGTVGVCRDGTDNDCDGDVDMQDRGCWWDSRWQRRLRLIVRNRHPTEPLRNFPLLVVLDRATIDSHGLSDNGHEIRFVASDGLQVFPHEKEQWNSKGMSFIWVRIPSIPPGNVEQFFWMYFGHPGAQDEQNPAKVWDSDYAAVWHLAQSSDKRAGFPDSTGNGNHATGTEISNDNRITGRIGPGLRLEGDGEYLKVCDKNCHPSLQLAGSGFTLEAWVRLFEDGLEGTTGVITSSRGPETERFLLGISKPSRLACRVTLDETPTGRLEQLGQPGIVPLGWSYIACTFNGQYLSGVLNDAVLEHLPAQGQVKPDSNQQDKVVLGKREFERYFQGDLDELRISKTARSEAYLQAQPAMMNGEMVSFGEIEVYR